MKTRQFIVVLGMLFLIQGTLLKNDIFIVGLIIQIIATLFMISVFIIKDD